MTYDPSVDITQSLSRGWRPLWSDFERIQYLRELISGTRTRLEDLRKEPLQNGEAIVFEETVLSSTEKELRKLEYKISVGENS